MYRLVIDVSSDEDMTIIGDTLNDWFSNSDLLGPLKDYLIVHYSDEKGYYNRINSWRGTC